MSVVVKEMAALYNEFAGTACDFLHKEMVLVLANEMILAYDIGTSSVKTSLVSADGHIVASASHAYLTAHPKSGYAEQDPEDWWRGMCVTTKEVMQLPAAHIAAIGISGHMMGCVPVDIGGNALYPCMIHTDSRAAVQYNTLDKVVGSDVIYRMTGNVLAARKPICKIMWLKDNERAVYNAAARFLHAKDYLAARLTGNIDTTDYSDACHSALIDINTMQYDPAFYREIGVDITKMPELHRGTDIIGMLTPQSAAQLGLPSGIPVIAGGGDGVCANVGTGVVSPGGAYCCLGTTAWIAQCMDAPVIDPHQRLFNLISVDGQTCSVYGTTQSAGAAVDWTADMLGETDMSAFNNAAAKVPAGSNGLIFLSYLEGERSPVYDANARGMFFGLSIRHTRAHMMRAALEGVAYALRTIIEVHRETRSIDSMRMIGGGAKSALWKQIIATAGRIRIDTLDVAAADATSLGIAMAAGVSVGMFTDLSDATKHIRVTDTCAPGEDAAAYDQAFEIYRELYPRTKELTDRMAAWGV
jgi:xylulokinase